MNFPITDIMRQMPLAFLIALVVCATGYSKDTNIVGSVDGVWKVESISMAGKRSDDPPKGMALITFTNSQMIMDDGAAEYEFEYTINTAVQPWEMDQTMKVGSKAFTTQSIYKREGNMLTVAAPVRPGNPRPTSFSPTNESNFSMMTLRLLSPDELKKFRQLGESDAGKAAMADLRKVGARFEMNTNRMVRTVMLSGTSVSDADLKLLASFKELDSLSLLRTSVGKDGLKHVASVAKLRRLNLSMTKVGDAGIEALAGLSQLEVLSLVGTDVTDASVKTLTKLKQLKEIDLSLTSVTPEAKKRLSQALPNCKVD